MLKSLLSSPEISTLQSALSAASLRHKVISNNIANVNTPGFKRSEVLFENELQKALDGTEPTLAKTNKNHFDGQQDPFTPIVNTVTNTTLRADGNNVDVDVEMADMAKNNIYYDAVAQQIGTYFANIKSVINGGKS